MLSFCFSGAFLVSLFAYPCNIFCLYCRLQGSGVGGLNYFFLCYFVISSSVYYYYYVTAIASLPFQDRRENLLVGRETRQLKRVSSTVLRSASTPPSGWMFASTLLVSANDTQYKRRHLVINSPEKKYSRLALAQPWNGHKNLKSKFRTGTGRIYEALNPSNSDQVQGFHNFITIRFLKQFNHHQAAEVFGNRSSAYALYSQDQSS
jgi:hypothetical protein